MLKSVVIHHGTLVNQSNRAIGNRGIAETLGRPRATLENQGTTGNKIQVVERSESIMMLTAEATKVQLATLLGRPNANGPTGPSQAHAVPSRPTIERRVLVATAHRTLGVIVVAEITRTQPLKIKSQARRLLRRSLP